DTVRAVYDQLVAGMGRPLFQGVQKRRQVQALPGSRARRRWGSGGLAVFMSEVIGVGMWREWHRQRIGVDAGRYVLVVERLFDADLRVGVVLGAQVAPDLRALRLAVAVHE